MNRLAATLVWIVLLAGPMARAQGPLPSDDAALRKRVLTSIARAQSFLKEQQLRDGSWPPTAVPGGEDHRVGLSSLAVLALLNSGLTDEDPSVAAGLRYLRTVQDPEETYNLATMIMALAAAGDRDIGRITRLANRLASIQRQGGDGRGAWGYGDRSRVGWWDNSNTQFALLGLREAAYAGVSIDQEVWELAQDHWLQGQGGGFAFDGGQRGNGWDYTGGRSAGGTGSMTVAGVASLTITSEFLRNQAGETATGDIDCCGADPDDDQARAAIESGKRWLATNFRVSTNPGHSQYQLYYLYGLERAGRLTGTRLFGDRDWYREGARHLVENQDIRNGFWVSTSERDEVLGTCYALLFLSKGLAPVLINKLEFGRPNPADHNSDKPDAGYWNVHPRDVANLTQYISGREKWPKLVTWQVVDLKLAAAEDGVAALLQAPVQYMCGNENPSVISDAEVALLREYIDQGGFLFAVQPCGRAAFEDGFANLITRMYPDGDFKLERLPDTHDVYRSEFLFEEEPPELWGVDFGCRTAIIYAPYDHACRWDRWMRHDPPGRPAAVKTQIGKSVRLGVNVIAYATGRELADKLLSPEVVAHQADDPLNRGRTTIARLRHTGGFDTAPNALRRVQATLERFGVDISPLSPTIPASDPTLFDYPLVYMHGRKNFSLTNVERDQLQTYLENGGFLFADACCGARQFDDSFRKLIQQLFGRPLERIPIEHELFNTATGHDIRKVNRRIPLGGGEDGTLTREVTRGEPVLEGLELDGRYVVVYSKYDLSCALERQATVTCAGYPTEDAAQIAANIVLYGLMQ